MQNIVARLEGDQIHVYIVCFYDDNQMVMLSRHPAVIPTHRQDSIPLDSSHLLATHWAIRHTREF